MRESSKSAGCGRAASTGSCVRTHGEQVSKQVNVRGFPRSSEQPHASRDTQKTASPPLGRNGFPLMGDTLGFGSLIDDVVRVYECNMSGEC